MPATSEPASGSVMPRAPMVSPLMPGTIYFSFCSGVPKRFICGMAMAMWAPMPEATPAGAAAGHLLV